MQEERLRELIKKLRCSNWRHKGYEVNELGQWIADELEQALSAAPRETPRNLQAEPAYPGFDTVCMSIRYPDWTIHCKTALCDKDFPHLTHQCGEWAAAPAPSPLTEDEK